MKEKEGTSASGVSRRDFLHIGAAGLAVAGLGMASCSSGKKLSTKPAIVTNTPMEKLRVGFVGTGMQGSGHVRNFINIENVEIKAICDIVPEKVERMQKWIEKSGQPKPAGYSKGEYDFVRMCENEDLDLVYTATPWNWHVPVCVAAMENGKHAATEVPAAVTIDDCWKLVETAEKYKKHCVMMENCNYNRRAMMVLNMVRQGLLGEILHGEGGYLHDLRNYKLGGLYEGDWRVYHSMKRNGNLYPTHGLGPIAWYMNINRGDRFDYLVSMSSPGRGLQEYAMAKLGPDNKFTKATYKLGDVNTSLIMTNKGKTIFLSHDTNLPRPYSRIDMIQGTKGIVHGYPDRIHIEGRTEGHGWEDIENYREEFDHPLWKTVGDKAAGAGHGGMDYLEDYRLVEAIRRGEPTDLNVYDAAAWSAISECTEISVAHGSKPVKIPDFTRGMWKTQEPMGIVV